MKKYPMKDFIDFHICFPYNLALFNLGYYGWLKWHLKELNNNK